MVIAAPPLDTTNHIMVRFCPYDTPRTSGSAFLLLKLNGTLFYGILFLEIHTPHEPKEQTMKFNTKVIHEGQGVDPVTLAHVSPLYQTSTYILPDYAAAVEANKPGDPGFHYSRTKHP